MLVARVKRSRYDDPAEELCIFEDLEYMEKKKLKKKTKYDSLSSSMALMNTSLTVDKIENLSNEIQEKINYQENLKNEYNKQLSNQENINLRNKIILKRISTISIKDNKEIDSQTAQVVSESYSQKRKRSEEDEFQSLENEESEKKKTNKIIITKSKKSLSIENKETCILVDMMQLNTSSTSSKPSKSASSSSSFSILSNPSAIKNYPFNYLSFNKISLLTKLPSQLTQFVSENPFLKEKIKFTIQSPPDRSMITILVNSINNKANNMSDIWSQILLGYNVLTSFHFKLSVSETKTSYYFFNFNLFFYFLLCSNLQNFNKFLNLYSSKFNLFSDNLIIIRESNNQLDQLNLGNYSISSLIDFVGCLNRLSQREVNEMKVSLNVKISEETKKLEKVDLDEDKKDDEEDEYVMDIFTIETLPIESDKDNSPINFAPLKNNTEEIKLGQSVVHIDGLKILEDGQVEILDDLIDNEDGNLSDLYDDEEVDSNDERYYANDYPEEEDDEEGEEYEERRRREEEEYDEDIYYDEFYGGDNLTLNKNKNKNKNDFLYDSVSYSKNEEDEVNEELEEDDALTKIKKSMKSMEQSRRIKYSAHDDLRKNFFTRNSAHFGSISSLTPYQQERFDHFSRQLNQLDNLDNHMDINFISPSFPLRDSNFNQDDDDDDDDEFFDEENEDEIEQHYGGKDD